jgi:oligoribonuclease (3'-5' exoribonuclease)
MQVKLNKPLIFLDIEATGLSIGSDRIVEICLLKLNVDNSTETKTVRINPEMPSQMLFQKYMVFMIKILLMHQTLKRLRLVY